MTDSLIMFMAGVISGGWGCFVCWWVYDLRLAARQDNYNRGVGGVQTPTLRVVEWVTQDDYDTARRFADSVSYHEILTLVDAPHKVDAWRNGFVAGMVADKAVRLEGERK